MRFTKSAPAETELNVDEARFELYSADAASDPPGHPRVIVIIPGYPTPVRVDMPLSDVLSKKQVSGLDGYRETFLQAALAKEGLSERADDLAEGDGESNT